MTTDYLVIQRFKCLSCDGAGFVQHPAWTEFYEPGEVPDFDARARELGYAKCDDMPEEEIKCAICSGKGHIRGEVPLAEALTQLGIFRN